MILELNSPEIATLVIGRFAIPNLKFKQNVENLIGAQPTFLAMRTILIRAGLGDVLKTYNITEDTDLATIEQTILECIDSQSPPTQDIFHLIQLWGGQTGRNYYVQNGTIDFEVYEKSMSYFKNCTSYDLDEALKQYKRLECASHQLGVAFITKHIRFWSKVNQGNLSYPIFDKNMAQLSLGLKNAHSNKLRIYWDGMLTVSNQMEIDIQSIERSLFNFYRLGMVGWARPIQL